MPEIINQKPPMGCRGVWYAGWQVQDAIRKYVERFGHEPSRVWWWMENRILHVSCEG